MATERIAACRPLFLLDPVREMDRGVLLKLLVEPVEVWVVAPVEHVVEVGPARDPDEVCVSERAAIPEQPWLLAEERVEVGVGLANLLAPKSMSAAFSCPSTPLSNAYQSGEKES